MKTTVIAGLAILISLSGCTKIVYLEQETPAGMVPRALVPPSPGPEQGLQGAYQANVMAVNQLDAQAVAERFRTAYGKARQPRIAIYLNRALSDEVREWKADERIVVAERIRAQAAYEKTATGEAATKGVLAIADGDSETRKSLAGQLAADGEISASHQILMEDQPRPSGGEAWRWALEDGFSQPLLDAGTKLVDRGTILRLTAAEKGKVETGQVAVKQIEMDALKGYSDLLIEILVADRYETNGKYEFRVSVKEVQSGQVLAHATTLYPGGEKRSQRFKATSHGFEAKGDDPFVTGRDLALNLMDSLARVWER